GPKSFCRFRRDRQADTLVIMLGKRDHLRLRSKRSISGRGLMPGADAVLSRRHSVEHEMASLIADSRLCARAVERRPGLRNRAHARPSDGLISIDDYACDLRRSRTDHDVKSSPARSFLELQPFFEYIVPTISYGLDVPAGVKAEDKNRIPAIVHRYDLK